MVKQSYFANYKILESQWYEDIKYLNGKNFKNQMIDFLQDIYKSLQPKQESELNTQIINGLTNALMNAIDEEADQSVIAHITDTLAKYIEKQLKKIKGLADMVRSFCY